MAGQTEGERIVALETWKISHEKGHEDNYKERLKSIEMRQDKIGSRVDGLFIAVLMVIAGMAGTIIALVSQ